MQQLHWHIYPSGGALVRRSCPRCGPATYQSSGRFRINANGARLDVWLVYNCTGCGKSWNLTLYERVSPAKLKATGQYERMLANDAALAAQVAGDTALLHRAGVQAQGAGFTLQAEVPPKGRACRVTLHCHVGAALRLDRLLAEGLDISRSEAARLLESGAVEAPGLTTKRLGRQAVWDGMQLTIRW